MTLKALRLCCRTFAELGTRYLFAQLSVYMTESSFIKMRTIAEHPVYSHMVHELNICPRLLDVFYDSHEYEMRIRMLLHPNPEQISNEEVDAAYGRFMEIWNDQITLSGRTETGLRAAMDGFTHLHSVTSSNWREYEMSYDRQLAVPNKNANNGILRMYHDDYWEGYEHITEDAMIITRATVSSSPLISGTLRRADIFGTFWLDLLDLSTEDLEWIKRLVTHLNCFDLTMCTGEMASWEDFSVESDRCRRVLESSADCLERLSVVDLGMYECKAAFAHIFGKIHWPRLSWFSLEGFYIHGNELITFLEGHRSTLKNLHLRKIILMSASWYKVFNELRSGVLLSIEFERLRVVDPEETFFGSDRHDVEEISRKRLKAFIIDKQPWPSAVLPAGLSREVRDSRLLIG